jgi:hypothetical protein
VVFLWGVLVGNQGHAHDENDGSSACGMIANCSGMHCVCGCHPAMGGGPLWDKTSSPLVGRRRGSSASGKREKEGVARRNGVCTSYNVGQREKAKGKAMGTFFCSSRNASRPTEQAIANFPGEGRSREAHSLKPQASSHKQQTPRRRAASVVCVCAMF